MITSQELIEDSFKLGIQIIKSGFAPTTILVLWRGGATIGMAIHELMRYKNFQLNHMIIKTSSYQNTDRQETVAIDGYQGLFESLKKDEKILIVDDIFDTGRTVSSVISLIKEYRKKESDQIKEIDGSIANEDLIVKINNTAVTPQMPMDTLNKLPDDKLFTSSLQGPEHK